MYFILKQLDQMIFTQPPEIEKIIEQKRQWIIQGLNNNHQKPWFGNIRQMTYQEVILDFMIYVPIILKLPKLGSLYIRITNGNMNN